MRSASPYRPDGMPATGALRVLLTTEGTYPYVLGGVSTWCDLLVRGIPEFRWQVLPVVAGETPRRLLFDVPGNVELLEDIEVWGLGHGPWERPVLLGGRDRPGLAGEIARHLLAWRSSAVSLVDLLVWCRQNPGRIRPAFRSRQGWASFRAAVAELAAERVDGVAPMPELPPVALAELYHALYWIARVAATPTPPADVLHVSAAGWAALPAVVHRAVHGTPLLLSEHGVYVREAYLAAIRSCEPAPRRWVSTRLALGLARLAYAASDVVAPVTDANAAWERALGVPPERIRVIHNGVPMAGSPAPLPGTKTVVSVGRIDPLKDVHTMLRVAAAVVRRLPEVTFRHYGPVPTGQERYGESCRRLHGELGLGDRFRFMGPTRDPMGALREADVVLMTSISEGFPIAALEALAAGRPIVGTAVGGMRDAVCGAGYLAPPGDVHRLADGLVTLLTDQRVASALAARGPARVARRFSHDRFLEQYRRVLGDLAGRAAVAA